MLNNFTSINENILSHNPIDLLAKLSYLSWMMKTNVFSDLDEQSVTYLQAKEALHYILSFIFSHKIPKISEKKINYDDLFLLIKNITFLDVEKEINGNALDSMSRKLNYTQKESGEILPSFYNVPFQHILSSEDSLILAKYNCNSNDLLNDFSLFSQRIFNAINIKGIKVKDFINKFDEICIWENLIIPSDVKSYDVWNFMSSKIGEIDESEFNPDFPLSLIKKHRKLLLQYRNSLYCFDLELIPHLIVRCVERSLQKDKKQNPAWDSNMKERTEFLVSNVFLHYLKGGRSLKNLKFKNDEFNGESDILFEYSDFLFIIEVKSSKLSPDPVDSNQSTVHQSYLSSVGKAESQCDKVEKHILKYGGCFFNNNTNITLKFNAQNIIKVVVTFEELSAVLPDENIQNENHTILLTYYDLLIVFNFINEPLLILKYYLERKKRINLPYNIADEMIYLGMFKDDINFIDKLNSQTIPNDVNKISTFILDPTSFTHEIEMYYTQPQYYTKPRINITDFQKILLKAFEGNGSIKDKIIFFLLPISYELGNQLMNIYYKNNDEYHFAPQTSLLGLKDGTFIGIMVSRKHKGDERYTYYAIAKRFFEIHSEAKSIISFISDDKTPYCEIINVDKKELNYQKTKNELAKIETTYGFKQTKLI